jgi:general secretion pathway protein L
LSTLYIRLPSKAAADSTPHWIALACPFALVSHGDAIEREGMAPLSDLSDMVAKAQRVVLLLAASDVTLLRIQVPPLSPSRLKSALPHLVEDQLMSDPAECTVVAGNASNGLRTVAVVNRGWLDILITTLRTYGARNIAALPAQLCLPYQPGIVSAAVTAQGTDIFDVALRLSEHEGIGLPIMPEQPDSAAHDVVQTICAIVPEAPITLYVPQPDVHTYQDVVNTLLALEQRITVFADNWSRWIAGARNAPVDLMAGSGAGSNAAVIDWRLWRWPIALAVAVLVINIVGLNIDWLRMRREADAVRTAMVQTYKAAYPKETVIVDPAAQMRQKIAAAEHDAGQVAPDDFTALAAGFGEAWQRVMQTPDRKSSTPGIAGLEYRDRSLLVRLKPGATMPADQMKLALAARNLSLSQPSAGVWQIRSTK